MSDTTVTIDLADDEQVERLAAAYVDAYRHMPWPESSSPSEHVRACMRAALREVTATEATS